jgi:hypothetical protein
MPQRATVLFANEALYAAFAGRDIDAMDSLWARNWPVSVIHPGWKLVTGRDSVMRSWQSILSNAGMPPITCHRAEANVIGEVAVVTCYEEIGGAVLAASNVFVREEGQWRLVHHQAGPCNEPPPLDDSDDDEPSSRMQ